jgi:hypothetical protein
MRLVEELRSRMAWPSPSPLFTISFLSIDVGHSLLLTSTNCRICLGIRTTTRAQVSSEMLLSSVPMLMIPRRAFSFTQCHHIHTTSQDGRFAYSYRVRPGVNRDSNGLKVAELAGFPQPALSMAADALLWLKSQSEGEIIRRSRLRAFGLSLVRRDK